MMTGRLSRGTLVLLIWTMSMSCAGGNDPSSASSSPSPEAAPSGGSAAAAPSFQEGRDYTVLERARFLDSAGFERPAEAFSVLLPRGWKHDGGVIWKSPQGCRAEMVSAQWSATSPDGAIRFQTLPLQSWGYASDPMMLQMMQMQAQHGGCGVGQPIDAETYLRQVMAPRELGGATITEVRANEPAQRELERGANASRAQILQYGAQNVEFAIGAVTARVRWDDGAEGIVFCSVVNVITTIHNQFTGQLQRTSSSTAVERSWVRFPADRRAEAESVLANLKSTYRTNPEWKNAVDGYMVRMRQQQDMQHHVRMQALADQTAANARAHAQRMADIQAQGAANTQRHEGRMAAMDQTMRSWEAQQSSQDRMHTSFVQAIREVETWQGADGRVELSSGYDQAWSRGDGTFILSNSPGFDPRAVFQDQTWKEMKREKQ